MRKVVVTEFVTLDGVFEDPGGSEGTPFGGWNMPFMDAEATKYKLEELFACDALLLGRVTYQGFAAAWPSIQDEMGFAERMNGLPKYVASNTLEKLDWNNSRLIKGNLTEEVTRLRQQPGLDIVIMGSGSLVHELLQADLVDEVRLMVHPVILGSGKRWLEGEIDRKSLKLVESKRLSSGVVVLVYQTAGTM